MSNFVLRGYGAAATQFLDDLVQALADGDAAVSIEAARAAADFVRDAADLSPMARAAAIERAHLRFDAMRIPTVPTPFGTIPDRCAALRTRMQIRIAQIARTPARAEAVF